MCARIIDAPDDQFAEHLEFRRLDGKERRASTALRLVCRSCVDLMLAAQRRGRRERDHATTATRGEAPTEAGATPKAFSAARQDDHQRACVVERTALSVAPRIPGGRRSP
jgi:hypothetical protein